MISGVWGLQQRAWLSLCTEVTDCILTAPWDGNTFVSSQNLRCNEYYTSNVILLKQTFSGPGAFLRSQTTTGELSFLDDVTSLVAYLGVRDVPVGRMRNEHNSHCRDAMRHRYHHQWCQSNLPHHTPRQRLLRRSQTMVYPVLLGDARMCWTCQFHGMDMVASNFDDRAPWE